MFFWQKPQPENLDEWLKIATKNIVDLEAQSIKTEIRGHYQDELEHQSNQQRTHTDVEKTALKELGNPYRANKDFQKSHVTESEWNFISKKTKESHLFSVTALIIICFLQFLLSFQTRSLFPPNLYLSVLCNTIKKYYFEKGDILLGLKYSIRVNLVFFPMFILICVFQVFFLDAKSWNLGFYIGFMALCFWGFFEGIKSGDQEIRKFRQFLQKNPPTR